MIDNTGKVYCDRQFQARNMCARVYHKNHLAGFLTAYRPLGVWLRQTVFGFAKLFWASPKFWAPPKSARLSWIKKVAKVYGGSVWSHKVYL